MTKPASSRELYLRLLQYVRPYWKAIVLSLCATAIMAATEPMFPALLKPLLDEGFTQQGGGMENPLLIPLGIVGVFLLRGVFNYFSSYGFSWVSNRVIADIRAEMYARMVRLPNAYFQKNASSVPLTKIAYDVNGVASAATTSPSLSTVTITLVAADATPFTS
jgi:subfamily B ATP-binding cassette protein MsbA